MLQSIHDNAKGWIAYVIVGLISVPFALWGIQEYIGGGSKNIVAVVNGEDIELQTVQNEVVQQRQQIAKMFGKLPAGFDEKSMRKSALDSIINQTLLTQHAEKFGYRASSQEVADLIKTIPAFQKEGVFDSETYKQIIASQRRSVSDFEQQIRNSLTDDQFRNGIADAAFLPKGAMERYQSLSQQKRDIESYTLKVEDVVNDIQISDEMIDKDYQANPQLFQTEEFVKVAYVELNKAEVSKSIDVTDELLQSYYTENESRYAENAKFKMSHIKVSITEAQNDDQAKAKADKLYAEISSGVKTFDDVAAISDDETIFSELGEAIGFLERGSKDPTMALIEEAVFAAKAGEVIQPVKTPSGYGIIKVLEIIPAQQKPFEQAKVQVEKEYRDEKASDRYEDLFESLRTTSFENDGSLEPSASAVGVEIKTTDFFSRKGGAGLTANPNIISAAFSPEVLTQGINSGVIEVSGSQVVVLRVDGHKPPELKPLADVRESIQSRLKQEQGKQQTKDKGDALLASIKASGNWDVLGAASSAVVKHAAVGRNDASVAPHILSKAFQLSVPQASQPQYASANSPSGDYSIIALTAVNNGDGKLDDASISQFTSYIGNRVQIATLNALREQADIEINLKGLEAE